MSVKARRSARIVLSLLAALSAPRLTRAETCPLPSGGAISGRVTAAATGAAIADAALVAERVVDGILTSIVTTTSGPTGHYQFAGLVPGDYFVYTQATALLVDEIWPGVHCDQACNPLDTGTTIPLAAGGSVEEIDFALAVGGRMEGTVRLADGVTPVPFARVESFALGPFGTFGAEPLLAGADGSWFVDGLESGNYKIRAYAPGLVAEVYPDTVCSMGCDVFPDGSPIAVTAGATTSAIDVALGPGVTVSGTVTDLTAAALAGVNVVVHRSPAFGSVSAQTDANGAWSTPEGLLPGTYFARTQSDNLDELWNDLPCEPFCTVTSGTPIVVDASPVSGIDFALARLGAISGTIVESGTGLPLANVTVSAQPSAGGFAGFASSAADGSYRIGGLVPESYGLIALDGVHVGEFYDDAGPCYDLLNCTPSSPATPVDVVGTDEVLGVDFELDRGGVLSGVVVAAATHAPVNPAVVDLFATDGGSVTAAFVDANGRFRIPGLPVGSYRAVAQPLSGTELFGEVWEEQPCVPGNCSPDAGAPVPVGLAAPACVTFTLDGVPEGAGIAGQVSGANGPLAGVQIAIYDASGTLAGTVFSDDSGAYLTNGALILPAGSYYALASGALGYANELFDDLPCVACDPTTGTPVVVAEGATTGGIDFDLVLLGPPPISLIFLEDCKPAGCVYFRGTFEDSRTNRSTLLGPSTATLPPFALPAEFWDDLVACVQRAYRPFAVEVTDVEPGSVPHLEHVIAGLPQHIGEPGSTAGVSPFSCSFIPNSISFTFAGLHGTVPSPEILNELCWTAVHEIGHQHGLEHHAYVPDAMTYATGCGPKVLPARDVACGELTPEPCICGGPSENSYARIRAVHGAGALLFGDGFEVVEPGQNCAWSQEVPPPLALSPPFAADPLGAPRCGALEPWNPGFQPRPRAPH